MSPYVTSYSSQQAAQPAQGRASRRPITPTIRLSFAINGGPQFQFSPAISMMVSCITQREIDHLWDQLSHGGETPQCGWLRDRFGLSWQIVPAILSELMTGDADKSNRVVQALRGMVKLDIAELKRAAKSS